MSNLGSWMQTFGLGWLVVDLAVRDGSPHQAPLYLGLVGFARAVPGVALGLLGGALADRLPLLHLIRAMQLVAAVISLGLAVMTATNTVTIGAVVVAAAALATVLSFEGPPRQALLPRLVPREELMSALGVNAMTFNAAQVIGPAIGGLLIGPIGIAGLFYANAASYAAVLTMTMFMRPQLPLHETPAPLLRSVGEGIRYMRSDPVIRWLIVLAVTAAFFARPYTYLLPAFTVNVLGLDASALSQLMSATGLGAVSGAIVVSGLGGARQIGLLVLGSSAALGVTVAVFSLQRELAGALVAAFAVGVSTIIFTGVQNSIFQLASHSHMLGRVLSVIGIIWIGFLPLGQLALGSLGAVIGIERALLLGGIVTFAAAALHYWRAVPLRKMSSARIPHYHSTRFA